MNKEPRLIDIWEELKAAGARDLSLNRYPDTLVYTIQSDSRRVTFSPTENGNSWEVMIEKNGWLQGIYSCGTVQEAINLSVEVFRN